MYGSALLRHAMVQGGRAVPVDPPVGPNLRHHKRPHRGAWVRGRHVLRKHHGGMHRPAERRTMPQMRRAYESTYHSWADCSVAYGWMCRDTLGHSVAPSNTGTMLMLALCAPGCQ